MCYLAWEPSPHLFQAEDLVVDLNGLRGIVAEASALYAIVQWEDGREEEVEQGDPSVHRDARVDDWEDEDEDTEEDGLPQYGALEFAEVEDAFAFWNTAGPKPEAPPTIIPEIREAA